jgi:hypothetical protein
MGITTTMMMAAAMKRACAPFVPSFRIVPGVGTKNRWYKVAHGLKEN